MYKKQNEYLLLNDNNAIDFEFLVDKNREQSYYQDSLAIYLAAIQKN